MTSLWHLEWGFIRFFSPFTVFNAGWMTSVVSFHMYFFLIQSHCFICLAAPAIVSSAVEIGSTECCDMYRCIVKVKVQMYTFSGRIFSPFWFESKVSVDSCLTFGMCDGWLLLRVNLIPQRFPYSRFAWNGHYRFVFHCY